MAAQLLYGSRILISTTGLDSLPAGSWWRSGVISSGGAADIFIEFKNVTTIGGSARGAGSLYYSKSLRTDNTLFEGGLTPGPGVWTPAQEEWKSLDEILRANAKADAAAHTFRRIGLIGEYPTQQFIIAIQNNVGSTFGVGNELWYQTVTWQDV